MNIQETEARLKQYINSQVDSLAKTNPAVGFIKPLFTRALDKKISKLGSVLELVSDENGNVDVAGILTEMMTGVTDSQPFVMNVPVLGDVEVGGGSIKLSLPLIDKKLVLNSADLVSFKNYMTSK